MAGRLYAPAGPLMIPFGTNLRGGQDISFPRQTVFPQDPSYMAGNKALMMRRRAVGRPFGVPAARVAGEPELGDIGDAIGGGAEVLGPDQTPGFPGGATPHVTFTPPAPFPEQPQPPETDEVAKALALGKAGLGTVGKLVSVLTSKSPGTAVQRNEAALQEQRAGERTDLGDLGDVLGGGTQVSDLSHIAPDLAGDLGSSFNPVPGGGTQVPQFDVASDLETSFNPGDAAGVPTATDIGGVGLGDVASDVGAATGIAGTALSDRPDLQKALIASAQAYPLAAEAVGALGGQVAGEAAAEAIPYVGTAVTLAMIGENLANRNKNATPQQKEQEQRQLVWLVGGLAASLLVPYGGLLFSVGQLVDMVARILDANNQTPPEGANWNEWKSIVTGRALADKLPETFQHAENPLQLLGLALAGPSLAPHGEVLIHHDAWGSSGDYANPVSPELVKNVEKIASTGDPDLMRQFIKGVTIKTGETGATKEDWLLTDMYRRTLVSLLPATHPVRQQAEANPDDLFGATPARYSATGGMDELLNAATTYRPYSNVDASTTALYLALHRLEAGETPGIGESGQVAQGAVRTWHPSSLFRRPGELDLTPEQRAYYISRLQQILGPSEYKDSLRAGGGDYGFSAAPDDPALMAAYLQRLQETANSQGSE